ncbi:amidohydrolase family protein [Sphingosinicella sp. LHD-64]|uniref:amidohydrolase family protein n=1 Tax=Sphingosinicella sp. LHD-64 TaxID=3072139 RepID=UPI00280D8EAE|nr:amidohydrolase family protein [Sphingosinicella sp. LHD-64]MDQ8756699.1 amidohydrolase family protein [Sphingosinicella sp. LHD-64]
MLKYAIIAILSVLGLLPDPPAMAQSAGTYAITNVTVVPMDRERHLPDQTVVVRDGRIAAMGPAASTPVPDGATRIEGRGRYLMPGLAEMHAHVPPQADQAQWTEDVLFLYAANGITFARSMLGAPHHLALRERAARGEIVSPRIYTSGPSLNGNSVATPADGRRMVAEQKAAGYDFLKIHPGLDRARYDAIAEAARTAGIPFGGHVPVDVGLARALEVRQATVDHLDDFVTALLPEGAAPAGPGGFFGIYHAGAVDAARIPALAQRIRAAGVWNVPTESLIHHVLLASPTTEELLARPETAYVPPPMRAQWVQARNSQQAQPAYDAATAQRFTELRGRVIRALHDAGAGLLLGSDAPQIFQVPGFSIHHELRVLVAAGLTPYQALATGTRNVAVFLGEEGQAGTVAAGQRADLILLEADPLADVANVRRRAGVMVNGRWLAEAQIRARLAEIAARYRS